MWLKRRYRSILNLALSCSKCFNLFVLHAHIPGWLIFSALGVGSQRAKLPRTAFPMENIREMSAHAHVQIDTQTIPECCTLPLLWIQGWSLPALVNKGAGEPNLPVNLRIISKSPILEINSHNHLKKEGDEWEGLVCRYFLKVAWSPLAF